MNTLSYVKGFRAFRTYTNACKVIHIITGMQNIAVQAFLIPKSYMTLGIMLCSLKIQT